MVRVVSVPGEGACVTVCLLLDLQCSCFEPSALTQRIRSKRKHNRDDDLVVGEI